MKPSRSPKRISIDLRGEAQYKTNQPKQTIEMRPKPKQLQNKENHAKQPHKSNNMKSPGIASIELV